MQPAVPLAGAVLLAFAACALAQEKDPKVPLGRDPGGVAVALVSTGIDYTLPEIANRLARDGEGEIIGWDFADNDNRPFDPARGKAPARHGGDGTALARSLIEASPVRLVPVRINPADPVSIARAIAFVARTPARIVAVPLWSGRREDWEPFRQAAGHFRHLLLVVPAGGEEGEGGTNTPTWPAAFKLDNVLAVAAAHDAGSRGAVGIEAIVADASGGPSAVAAAARSAACTLDAQSALSTGAALKQRILEGGKPSEQDAAVRVLPASACRRGSAKP